MAERTPARSLVVPDEDWTWLETFAAAHGTDRGSVVRRLVTVLRHDVDTRQRSMRRLDLRVMDTPDPVGDRRNAQLRNQRGDA